jgi:transcriptional regulator with GAF, ATPase, and Fis domain
MTSGQGTTQGREELWERMRRLLARLAQASDKKRFLDDCLDAVVDLLGADRGLVVLFHEDGGTQTINARAKGRALDAFEREEISKTIVRRARSEGAIVVWRPLDDVAASESLHALSIATAMAGPLAAFESDDEPATIRAVVYVDFRDHRRTVGPDQREFFEAALALMAMVFAPTHRLERAREDLRALSAKVSEGAPSLDELLRPDSMAPMRAEIASCLHGDSSILILGESGTGKTMFARAIAEASDKRPIVRATLGSSDDLNTITSELFGHEKGSFSGALGKRTGLVEFADQGTLIFDEILNLPPQAQQLLLDFTQFGTFRPLGHERAEPKRAKVRIIAATNGDLDGAMRAGKFRSDLYYRLATVTLDVPPLRARRAEIPSIAEGILERLDRARSFRIGLSLRRLLMSPGLPWAGNVRQLEAVMARARERCLHADPNARTLTHEHVTARDLGTTAIEVPSPSAVRDDTAPLSASFQIELDELGDSFARLLREREALDRAERTIVLAALEKHHGVTAHAARELGVPRTSLASRLTTLGIDKPKR